MTTGIPNSVTRSSSVAPLPNTDNTSTPKATSSETQPAASQHSVASVENSSESSSKSSLDNAKTASLEEVTQISDRLNESAQKIQRGLTFSVDESLGDIVIKVIDQDTQELIRQIPSEDMLKLSRNFEEVNSLLFDKIKA